MNSDEARLAELKQKLAAREVIVNTAEAAADLFRPIFESLETEHIVVAYLDRDGRLQGLEQFGLEQIDEAVLPIRSILAKALRVDAAGLILAQNHPSGDPSPSEADVTATRTLFQAARTLGVRLQDHIIFGAGEWRSMRALGLL